MTFRSRDFESRASTNSAIPAWLCIVRLQEQTMHHKDKGMTRNGQERSWEPFVDKFDTLLELAYCLDCKGNVSFVAG